MKKQTVEEQTLSFMYQALVYSRIDFSSEWRGWKLRGRELISPAGDRVSVERLKGILLVESLRLRGLKNRPCHLGNVVPLSRVWVQPTETAPAPLAAAGGDDREAVHPMASCTSPRAL